MKKRILISTHTLRLGGVERSFLGLLQKIDYSKFDVDVFLHKHDGELMKFLPENANLLPEIDEYRLLLEPITHSIKEFNIKAFFVKIVSKVYSKLFEGFTKLDKTKLDSIAHVHLHKIANYIFPKISAQEYDAVLAFLHPNFLEVNKTKAKKYLSFIHTDYSAINFDAKSEHKMWGKYDLIAGVSDDVAERFVSVFPDFKGKVKTIENIISDEFIKKQALEFSVKEELNLSSNELGLLSIGRFSYQKNFENIPYIAKKLIENGLFFKWFIIGFGGDEELIRKNIKEAGVKNHVFILGEKNNPYPYISACDYYIQPSRFEGKAVTVREAQILGKTVFITNYPTSKSQIKQAIDGFILSMDNDSFAKEFLHTIFDKHSIDNNRKYLSELDFTNKEEIKKIENFICS